MLEGNWGRGNFFPFLAVLIPQYSLATSAASPLGAIPKWVLIGVASCASKSVRSPLWSSGSRSPAAYFAEGRTPRSGTPRTRRRVHLPHRLEFLHRRLLEEPAEAAGGNPPPGRRPRRPARTPAPAGRPRAPSARSAGLASRTLRRRRRGGGGRVARRTITLLCWQGDRRGGGQADCVCRRTHCG